MLRRIVFSLVAAGALFAVSVWAVGWPAVVAQDASPSGLDTKSGEPSPATPAKEKRSSGERLLAQASPTAPLPGSRTAERPEIGSEAIVIPGGLLTLINQEAVPAGLPSQHEGVMLFIGTEIKDGQQVPPHEVVHQIGDKQYRRLKEGDEIKAHQLLAMVDDTLARADEAIKLAKVDSAVADRDAADKTRDEAQSRYETQQKLYYNNKGGIRATSLEDLRGALLTYNRYVEEAKSKEAAIIVANQELKQAQKMLAMYEIRPKISGFVKTIYKHPGEAIKSLETVLQIQNYQRLRVDATLPAAYANRLDKGMKVDIESPFPESPRQTLVGHRGVVTGVAVSKDQKPLLVSCSDDGTVRVWELSSGAARLRESRRLNHPCRVRAVACTPPTASANLCLSGDEQGNGRLWDLNDRTGEKVLRELKGKHRNPIRCVAFSADGQTCATGDEGREIKVWDTATGTLRYSISGHHNAVTALYFAPDSRLISVGLDAVRFWKLGAERAEPLENEPIQRRREVMVDNLGVSPDGQRMMDEQLGEMRVVSVPHTRTEAILRNAVFGKKFSNFALFSPDGQLALTTPETGGVLQLWRINFNQPRSSELRQFIVPVQPMRSVVKSAAFAPDRSFVVAAVNDRVYVWPMPGKEEVEPIPAYITNIEKPIEAIGENQVKLTAELENPGQRLRPGDVVTMIAYPQQ